mmetsp:Transcript_43553/g.106194  ORF Transcript_43553/g.106194 Transcript_43553/m.106194 type:complete len:97 (-) Transcript_43553:877-1167(-)
MGTLNGDVGPKPSLVALTGLGVIGWNFWFDSPATLSGGSPPPTGIERLFPFLFGPPSHSCFSSFSALGRCGSRTRMLDIKPVARLDTVAKGGAEKS